MSWYNLNFSLDSLKLTLKSISKLSQALTQHQKTENSKQK